MLKSKYCDSLQLNAMRLLLTFFFVYIRPNVATSFFKKKKLTIRNSLVESMVDNVDGCLTRIELIYLWNIIPVSRKLINWLRLTHISIKISRRVFIRDERRTYSERLDSIWMVNIPMQTTESSPFVCFLRCDGGNGKIRRSTFYQTNAKPLRRCGT